MQVSVAELTKTFRSKHEEVKALDRVSLITPPRKILTLLGPSGCGKTTLLRSIAGLENPDSGEIKVGDDVVWSKARGIAFPPERRGLGMVFQSYAIWPHMTVFDNVAYPLRLRKVPRHEVTRRVKAVLDMVQLGGLENRPATKLSGGQQQRVALARALVAEPKVILFDEPLSNLDAKLRESTRQELRAFITSLGLSSIYVTHDRVEALAISDEVAVMHRGAIVERGTPTELYFQSDNPFVVDFIGRANFVQATVVSYVGDGLALVDTPLGRMKAAAPPDLPPHGQATMYFRTESVERVQPGLPGEMNEFDGRVKAALFTGEAYEVRVEVNGVELLAKLGLADRVTEGDEVRFRVRPEWCRVLRPQS
ncbi:MAG: Putrescine transport ATP-binding protein PotA [Candidatus Bipolaricaulis sibiricus]|uniref:Putrescine transport ATP-binding protein PotA n=1 Tax=Bipolaricaulis sibiricus TaxID=2501609 RepID=A0A410FWA9_BIPS1|nr:MAG: Putrescine transport ATP-binding protein PotA [Candidatus Bipolaricaulis sibiricus]